MPFVGEKTPLEWAVVRDFPEVPAAGDPVVRLSRADAENGRIYYSVQPGRLGQNGRVMPHFPIFTQLKLGTVTFTDDIPNVFRDLLTEAREYVRIQTQEIANVEMEARESREKRSASRGVGQAKPGIKALGKMGGAKRKAVSE